MKGPLRHHDFRWLMIGRTVDAVGNSVAPVALAFAVRDITPSATSLGLVVAARSLTNVLLLLFGGVIADRFPRRLVMVGSAGAAAATQAVVAALVLTGAAEVWSLAVVSALNGAVSAVAFPASQAVVPATVPAEDLQAANGQLRVGLNLTGLLGVAVGVQLVALVGPGWGIAVDAASFAASALAFSRVRLPASASASEGSPAAAPATVVADIRAGWGAFVRNRWVWVVVAQFSLVNAATSGISGVLAPTVADETFGRSGYGVALTVFTVGLLLGSLVAIRIRVRRALLLGVAVILASALPGVALAAHPTVVVVAVAFFVSALGYDVFGIAWDLSLQENIAPDMLGRVYSYDVLGSIVAVPVGQVVVGPLAAAFGTQATLYGCAAVIVVPTLLAMADRSVRALERRPPELPA